VKPVVYLGEKVGDFRLAPRKDVSSGDPHFCKFWLTLP
jgi:hypothetical protein